jgi:hypothetical protein
MNWVILLSALVGWLLAGVAVAYLFGRFIRGVETQDNAGDLVSPVVRYMRRTKRVKTASRVRVPVQPKARRETATRH